MQSTSNDSSVAPGLRTLAAAPGDGAVGRGTNRLTDMVDDAGGAVASPAGTVCLAVIRGVRHDALAARYQEVHGAVDGEIELSNQFVRVFEEARTRARVATESFARYAPGAGYFTTESAGEAEALAAEMIRVAEEQNRATPDARLHKKIAAAVVTAPAPSASSATAAENFWIAHEAFRVAEQMVRAAEPGELRLTGAVHAGLSAEHRRNYEQLSGSAGSAGAKTAEAPPAAIVWRQRVASGAGLPRVVERCVMEIDMARFSRVQSYMMEMIGESGSGQLRQQIVEIIAAGFERAGAASYERYMSKWGGDGGIFFFEDPVLAHRVAVEILTQAEERRNRSARERNFEDALRCFRIGIDFGRLDRDEAGNYDGGPITRAERLQSGGPTGEVRVSEEFYRRLPEDLRRAYGDREPIFGKGHDDANGIPGRRLFVTERAPWTEVGRDNKPFPPVKQPNSDFPAAADAGPALELCFVICPLGDDQPRTAAVLGELITPACRKAGLEPRCAVDLPGDRKSVIAENLWNAPLVIAYLGDPADWNYNVILEVGIRLATGLPLVILSDALPDGREPDYQRLLPFQLVHHNVITVPPQPKLQLQKLTEEIGDSRARVTGAWESPNPVMEFKYTTFNDAVITDANETARAVFGAENVRKGQRVDQFRKFLTERTDASQAAARREEQIEILDALMARAVHGEDSAAGWRPRRARVPIVFKDAPVNPETGRPFGYLPIILRYHFDRQGTRVRYLYLRVSAAMRREEGAEYYVCDI